MNLTPSQLECFQSIRHALQCRKPVLLTGKSNGKTTLLHEAIEILTDAKSGITNTLASGHSENLTIEYFPRLYLASRTTVSVQTAMTQILQYAGEAPKKRDAATTVQAFDKLLKKLADAKRMICVAVDNAELLSARSYTILKVLNEYRDTENRRDIGVCVMLSGDILRLKRMPRTFLERCTEIAISKILPHEVEEMIMGLYPSYIRWFSDQSLEALTKCESTLQMKAVLERCIGERARLRLIEIDHSLVESKLAQVRARIAA